MPLRSTLWHGVAHRGRISVVNGQHEITQRDLRNRSAEIMRAVEHGERFVVTRSGTPIGELVPLQRRRFVPREQFAAASQNAPLIDAERFRSDLEGGLDARVSDPYDR